MRVIWSCCLGVSDVISDHGLTSPLCRLARADGLVVAAGCVAGGVITGAARDTVACPAHCPASTAPPTTATHVQFPFVTRAPLSRPSPRRSLISQSGHPVEIRRRLSPAVTAA